jgi:hypothetical protein
MNSVPWSHWTWSASTRLEQRREGCGHIIRAELPGAVRRIFIYRAATADELTVDFCVGVTASFPAIGAVVSMETPLGVAATTTHYGAYRGLGDANAAIVAWCRANSRRRAGASWEVYGHWHADPAQLRTDVYYLLQSSDVEARP